VPDTEKPPEPQAGGDSRPPNNTFRNVAIVVGVILAIVAMSFVGLGAGYLSALMKGH
jgi:hypothetical protein